MHHDVRGTVRVGRSAVRAKAIPAIDEAIVFVALVTSVLCRRVRNKS